MRDKGYLPTVDEVEESMASYVEEYNFVLPDDFQQAFVGWPGRDPTHQLGDVIDLEFEYDAPRSLLEERLAFRIPDIPHEELPAPAVGRMGRAAARCSSAPSTPRGSPRWRGASVQRAAPAPRAGCRCCGVPRDASAE